MTPHQHLMKLHGRRLADRAVACTRDEAKADWHSVKIPLHRVIHYGFTWNDTKEGHTFWYRIYEQICREG